MFSLTSLTLPPATPNRLLNPLNTIVHLSSSQADLPQVSRRGRLSGDSIHTPHLWKVAWDGEQVAGMVLNRLDETQNERYRRRRGHTNDIFVRRPWRRRGLARSLLVQSIEMFREMGMEETALGVDTQNPSGALNLYESVGYRMTRQHTFFNKRMER